MKSQRIAIARAVLKNSPVVLLDEATAFTDPENEAVIQDSINKLVQGKTLIVIAHRLSTITGAEKILVMDRGCINRTRNTSKNFYSSSALYSGVMDSHISVRKTRERRCLYDSPD